MPTTRCSSSTSPSGSSCIPGAGNRSGTLQNALLHSLPRACGVAARRSRPSARQGYERLAARRAYAGEPHGAQRRARAARDQAHVSRHLPRCADGRRQHRRADRPASARADQDGRGRRRPTRAHALSRRRAVSRAHLLRDRARDGAHASDTRAHGAHPRAVARRPRLRRPAEAAGRAERRVARRAARSAAPGAARDAAAFDPSRDGRGARVSRARSRPISSTCSRCLRADAAGAPR